MPAARRASTAAPNRPSVAASPDSQGRGTPRTNRRRPSCAAGPPATSGWPASTAYRAPTSATLRPIGPGVSWLAAIGATPSTGTVPTVGLSPTTPHREAGHVMDPSVSVPTARGT